MEPGSKFFIVASLFSMTVLINLPLGYLRRKERRFSFRWFLYIHLPIPVIFLARTLSHLDLRYIPLFILAAVLGQVCGSRIGA